MRQAGAPRSSACGRSRGLPIEFDEVAEGVPVSRGRDDRVERLAATAGEDDLALGQALDGARLSTRPARSWRRKPTSMIGGRLAVNGPHSAGPRP